MGNIILHDKEFRPFIEATKIDQVITRMAEQMNRELADTQPLFLSILNGSFMFTSDLIKQIVIPGTQINDFVVGRGLDYDGLGRNYPDLYILNA